MPAVGIAMTPACVTISTVTSAPVSCSAWASCLATSSSAQPPMAADRYGNSQAKQASSQNSQHAHMKLPQSGSACFQRLVRAARRNSPHCAGFNRRNAIY